MNAGQVMLAISLLFGLGFVLALGRPWRRRHVPMTWLQASLAWVAIGFDTWLLLSSFGVNADLLVVAVLFAQDVVFGWRLLLLLRIRRQAAYDRRKEQPEKEVSS